MPDDDRESPERSDDAAEAIEIEFCDDTANEGESDIIIDADNVEPIEIIDTNGPEKPDDGDLDALRDELEHVREMYLRKLAEFDNFRKRTDREREEQQRIGSEVLARELLPVLDNFERALQHAGNGDPEAFHEGVEIIARHLADTLQRQGLEAIDPEGEVFDPELHEAVHRVEDSGRELGTVVMVLTKGYTFGGRLIRPAMVGVAVETSSAPKSTMAEKDAQDDGGRDA